MSAHDRAQVLAACVGLLCIAGCGPALPQESATGGEAQTSTSTGAPTSTGAGATSTSGDGTTAGFSFETCGEATETGLDPIPTDAPNCVDPQVDWQEKHVDCALDCSTKTSLHGVGPAAGLVLVSRITFDVSYGACGKGLHLRRLHLGHPSAPTAVVWVGLTCGLDPWLGAHAVTGTLADETPFTATLTIDGYAGDWVSPDPIDPPRLFGTFSGDLVGPFEATHCASNDGYQDNCA